MPALLKIPHCCLPKECEPCLSSAVAVRPPKPARDQRLGKCNVTNYLISRLPISLRIRSFFEHKATITPIHIKSKHPKTVSFLRNLRLVALKNYIRHLIFGISTLYKCYPEQRGRDNRSTHPYATYVPNIRSTCMCPKPTPSVQSEPGSNPFTKSLTRKQN